MNEKEAELIGAHVGDGTLYRTNGNSIVWELRGSIHEQEYYAHMAQMLLELFNIPITPKYRGINSYGIQTCKKPITHFFIEQGFNPGSKVYTVSIPDRIKAETIEIKRSFLRGLFDTDGCVLFEKNRTAFRYYPRIEFGFASKALRDDLINLFNELEFLFHFWNTKREDGEDFKIALCGFKNLDRWIKEISPANSKHLRRIEEGLLNKDKVKLKKASTNI